MAWHSTAGPCFDRIVITYRAWEGLRITLGGDLSVAVDGIDLREVRQRRHRNGIGRVVGLP